MAVIELVVFVSFALISKEVADPFLGPYSGPVTLITTLVLLTAYMRLRGQNWSSMGLRALPGLKEKLMVIPRAFLITRVQTIFDGNKYASIFAVLFPALLFGAVHFYSQGLAGFVNAGTIGLIFGTFFLRYKGNLWPLILVHGFINSIGFTVDYLGGILQ